MLDRGRLLELVAEVVLEDARLKAAGGIQLAGLAEGDAFDERVLSPVAGVGTPKSSLEVRLSIR